MPSSPACMEKSQPGSSQHSLPAKEEPPRVGEEKPKAPKASSRVEDAGLDTVAPRTVSEHVAITKPETTVTTVSHKMNNHRNWDKTEETLIICALSFFFFVWSY